MSRLLAVCGTDRRLRSSQQRSALCLKSAPAHLRGIGALGALGAGACTPRSAIPESQSILSGFAPPASVPEHRSRRQHPSCRRGLCAHRGAHAMAHSGACWACWRGGIRAGTGGTLCGRARPKPRRAGASRCGAALCGPRRVCILQPSHGLQVWRARGRRRGRAVRPSRATGTLGGTGGSHESRARGPPSQRKSALLPPRGGQGRREVAAGGP